jgi:hypothetical protein
VKDEVRKIVDKHTDMMEAAKELVEKEFAVSFSQGKRIFFLAKDRNKKDKDADTNP